MKRSQVRYPDFLSIHTCYLQKHSEKNKIRKKGKRVRGGWMKSERVWKEKTMRCLLGILSSKRGKVKPEPPLPPVRNTLPFASLRNRSPVQTFRLFASCTNFLIFIHYLPGLFCSPFCSVWLWMASSWPSGATSLLQTLKIGLIMGKKSSSGHAAHLIMWVQFRILNRPIKCHISYELLCACYACMQP